MQYRHANKTLQKIDEDADYNGSFSDQVANKFRQRMELIRAADNENDLRALKSLHFEKLKGKRQHQYSITLDKQFRLVFEIEKDRSGNTIVVVQIVDYH
jgi:toxin HigB-1